MSRSRKISVGAVLGIGVFDTLLGLTRLITLLCNQLNWPEPTDIARYKITVVDVVGVFEPAVAVIVCALPVYKLLLPCFKEREQDETELQRNAATMGTVTTVESNQASQVLH